MHLTVTAVPPAVSILTKSGVAKIYRTVVDIPPATCILCQARIIEIYFSVCDLPPATGICTYIIVKNNLTVYHFPPAIRAVYRSFDHTIVVELYFTSTAVPPAVSIPPKTVVAEVQHTV